MDHRYASTGDRPAAAATPISVTPYWMDDMPPPPLPGGALPERVDVLIVGAGYTGLSAACVTAAAGRSTLVVDAGTLGTGCSSRNGGQVAYSFKPSHADLTRRYGADTARRIAAEGVNAIENLRTLATLEHLDCDWRAVGGFYGAHTRRHFERVVREAESDQRVTGQRFSVVPRAAQHGEIATDFYHGGLVYHGDAAVHPMRLLAALVGRALAAGATILECCAALDIQAGRTGFEVRTTRGIVRAQRVLLATNGYTGALSPWHRRRVIPIGSYQIATAPLGAARVRALIPAGRNIGDTRRVVVYYRPSPDGERIIFGGRAALSETNPLTCVPRLRGMLGEIFPQLRDCPVTHAWPGFVAYTFDTMPHLGERDGLFHCMGYCGQGVPTATYFGRRIGQQMLGLAEGRTALDGLAFPTRPFYKGVPWFMAPSVFYYRTLDRIGV
jgi:glycine/D-amino acid oxidase-like deaminating enzyme